ncbi:MAG: 30S ribosomal protein S12 methylthiotransferase RimO [Candidatus Omnitrophica bacterium]|nr:30S ribosomal protein S12 methylthiotransferase RimO [Candidatus Omnitrophota bacterium]
MAKKIKVALISLGCPRNLVDSEVMLGILKKGGFGVTEDFNNCDAAIINTCAFIEDAKKESLDLILQVAWLKTENKIRALVVTGCLPQRYHSELKKELKEVDAFLGTGDFINIAQTLKDILAGRPAKKDPGKPVFLYDHTYPRELITPKHSVYLKLSEGCNNNCSYCIIPSIRGALRSRGIESLLAEAKALSGRHRISEINLIGQDITLYGTDLKGAPGLSGLIRKLAGLNIAHWIRLLYTHPEHYTDELITVVREEPSVCKYLDIPLQHINDRILKSMNRNTRKVDIMNLIKRLRKEIPGLALRTTFIVGFPGETDEEFKELMTFIGETRFERLGVFEYSKEEGTRAYTFPGHVPEKIKRSRFDAVMKLQQEVAKEVNRKFLGEDLEVLIDEKADKPYNYIGRTEYDAPEVDGSCFIRTKALYRPGDFVRVKITDTLEYDLIGEEQ